MEDETVQAVKKVAIGSAILAGTVAVARAAGGRFNKFDKRMKSKNKKIKKKRPLPNKSYRVVMSKEDKHKLGINMKW